MLQQGVLNVSHVQKELCARPEDLQHTNFVLMEPIQMWKAWVIVNSVIQDSNVQVLEWKHQKSVLMEHIATQMVLGFVFCVQKAKGDYPTVYPYRVSFTHTYWWVVTQTGCTYHLIIQWLIHIVFFHSYLYILAGCYTDRLLISSDYPTVHPYCVLFIHTYWLVVTQTSCRYHLINLLFSRVFFICIIQHWIYALFCSLLLTNHQICSSSKKINRLNMTITTVSKFPNCFQLV